MSVEIYDISWEEMGICPDCKDHTDFKVDENGDPISECCGA